MLYAKKLHYCLNIQNQKEKLCAINIIRLKYRFSKGRKVSKVQQSYADVLRIYKDFMVKLPQNCKATLLKSHFSMDVLLDICLMF